MDSRIYTEGVNFKTDITFYIEKENLSVFTISNAKQHQVPIVGDLITLLVKSDDDTKKEVVGEYNDFYIKYIKRQYVINEENDRFKLHIFVSLIRD